MKSTRHNPTLRIGFTGLLWLMSITLAITSCGGDLGLAESETETTTTVTETTATPSPTPTSTPTPTPTPETTETTQEPSPTPTPEPTATPTPTPEPTATQTPTPVPETMVYVSSKGKKYHSRPGCSNMKSPKEITESQAKKKGYTACGKCW